MYSNGSTRCVVERIVVCSIQKPQMMMINALLLFRARTAATQLECSNRLWALLLVVTVEKEVSESERRAAKGAESAGRSAR